MDKQTLLGLGGINARSSTFHIEDDGERKYNFPRLVLLSFLRLIFPNWEFVLFCVITIMDISLIL